MRAPTAIWRRLLLQVQLLAQACIGLARLHPHACRADDTFRHCSLMAERLASLRRAKMLSPWCADMPEVQPPHVCAPSAATNNHPWKCRLYDVALA